MKNILIFFFFSVAMIFKTSAQNDSIIINQDSKLSKVLELKKIVNQEAYTSGQYTVQIYSGNFKDYQELLNSINEKKEFEKVFFSFETPYYKIRVGKYVSKIKAIKELKKIKKKYPSAFILQPN